MGDPRAQRALYDAHAGRVYRIALRLSGDEELARDFTQEAFIRAFRQLHTFRGQAAFSTWLHRITVNVTLSGLRKIWRLRSLECSLDGAQLPHAASRGGDPMLRDRIQEALAALPELSRVVVVMHDIEGLTHGEIGKILDIPTGTSKARLSRARAELRGLLDDCALEYSVSHERPRRGRTAAAHMGAMADPEGVEADPASAPRARRRTRYAATG